MYIWHAYVIPWLRCQYFMWNTKIIPISSAACANFRKTLISNIVSCFFRLTRRLKTEPLSIIMVSFRYIFCKKNLVNNWSAFIFIWSSFKRSFSIFSFNNEIRHCASTQKSHKLKIWKLSFDMMNKYSEARLRVWIDHQNVHLPN